MGSGDDHLGTDTGERMGGMGPPPVGHVQLDRAGAQDPHAVVVPPRTTRSPGGAIRPA